MTASDGDGGTFDLLPLGPAHRDELLRMRTALWPDSTADEVDALVARADEPGYRVLMARADDGRMVGFAEVGTRPFAEGCRTSPVAYLEGIWVEPGARRARAR